MAFERPDWYKVVALTAVSLAGDFRVFRTPDRNVLHSMIPDYSMDKRVAIGKAEFAADYALQPLLFAMAKGDEHALECLYDATVGKLYALAFAILRRKEDAEEAVCATYAYAWTNVAKYDSQRANPLGWLLMLCRSRAIDQLRRQRVQSAADIAALIERAADNPIRPDELLNLVQEQDRVHAALAGLTPERRRLVSMAFLQGLSHGEIATHTGLPLGTVKSHLRRALTQLRAQLEVS